MPADLEHNPYYRCLCNTMHVKVGAIWIGVSEILAVVIDAFIILLGGYFWSSHENDRFDPLLLIYASVPLIVTPIVVGLMIYGIYRVRAGLIVPHLICQVLAILLLLLAVGLALAKLARLTNVFELAAVDDVDKSGGGDVDVDPTASPRGGYYGLTVFNIILFAATAAIEIWFIYVVYKCYLYVKRKAAVVGSPNFAV